MCLQSAPCIENRIVPLEVHEEIIEPVETKYVIALFT